jgi:hypothetical protein
VVKDAPSKRLVAIEDTLAQKAVRPAKEDDICILVYTNNLEENAHMRGSQAVLQNILGGRIVVPVHLTSHRFEAQDARVVDLLLQDLADKLKRFHPFPITALSYVPLYSAFREVNLLKWRIRTNVELYEFTMKVNSVLEASGIQSIYPPGWVSSLVTALEDIPEIIYDRHELNQSLQIVKEPFPRHLFTANEVALSRVKGPEEYETLEKIVLT